MPEWQAVNHEPVVRDRRGRRHPGVRKAEGVLFAQGTRFGGHALYVKDNRLHYLNNFLGSEEQNVVGDRGRADRREAHPLGVVREDEGSEPIARAGTLTLYHGDEKVGEGEIKTQLGAFAIAGSGLYVGRHEGEPLTGDFPGEAPHRFTGGTINRLAIDVSGEPYLDLEREAELMLMRE